MRVFHRVGRLAGLAALAASALLASPGVEAVRAEPRAASSAPAEQCGEAAQSPANQQADVDAFVAQLRREHGADLAAQAEANGIIVLNNRGYNYGAQNDPSSIKLPPELSR